MLWKSKENDNIHAAYVKPKLRVLRVESSMSLGYYG